MTRKDYELIADTIRTYRNDCFPESLPPITGLTRLLAARLEETIPNFDRARFLKACGLDS